MPNSFARPVTVPRSETWTAPLEKTTFTSARTALPGLTAQIALGFALIELALWAPIGLPTALLSLAALAWVFIFSIAGEFSASAMGLGRPQLRGSLWMIAIALALAGSIAFSSRLLASGEPSLHRMEFGAASLYALWALVQQFLLQSFFFVRLERLLDGKRAVVAAALLFAAAHIPNLLLTLFSFLGGLFFCQMFRRYRNVYVLGFAHAVLGLTLAASFSDARLHHMLVGMGYMLFNS